ncbi:hypothetical protein HJG53_11060 [Sphingomonas sp. ID1715]|uniref:AbiTii domain-containing protein n=1 Tax=Sphingomonas sp. ID1715 TaxID=1656898 RepID=UPI0014880995|nr:hypothetical protein [Sphingomonas sp. ID1715]
MTKGIVLELQQECLDANVRASAILRKAKVIAVKLELDDLSHWIDQELNGYECSLKELPGHRKLGGSPKFWNPYNGWCPIIPQDEFLSEQLTTAYVTNPIAQLEEWVEKEGGTLHYRFPHFIQEFLRKHSDFPFEAVMHMSTSQVASSLDFVRNKVLSWTLELERMGITGIGYTFKNEQKLEALAVTNHIYGGNIGVLGNVSGDANNSHFINSSGVDVCRLRTFLDQMTPAAAGLDADTRKQVEPLLGDLRTEADRGPERGRVSKLLGSLKAVLEGASGNLVASAMLGALNGGMAG